MEEREMEQVGRLIARALAAVDNDTELAAVKRDVQKLCDRFPLYATRLEAYERALAARA
jgi:glycine hydroxymethyltransferase